MDLQNDQNSPHKVTKMAQKADQADASAVSINSPVQPKTDDMELNEEQLDIISGGDGNNPFYRG